MKALIVDPRLAESAELSAFLTVLCRGREGGSPRQAVLKCA
jgi:hypothetical protein